MYINIMYTKDNDRLTFRLSSIYRAIGIPPSLCLFVYSMFITIIIIYRIDNLTESI